MKLYKPAKEREDLCKKLHKGMNLQVGPTKLVPNLFLVADTDELQKQVNRLENRVNRMEQVASRRAWVHGTVKKTKKHKKRG